MNYWMSRGIRIGDVVILNGTNTQMTVAQIFQYSCRCLWFDHNNELNEDIFNYNDLKRIG